MVEVATRSAQIERSSMKVNWDLKLKRVIFELGGEFVRLPDGREIQRRFRLSNLSDGSVSVELLARDRIGQTTLYGPEEVIGFNSVFTVVEQAKIRAVFSSSFEFSKTSTDNKWLFKPRKVDYKRGVGLGELAVLTEKNWKSFLVNVSPDNNPFLAVYNRNGIRPRDSQMDVSYFLSELEKMYKNCRLPKWEKDFVRMRRAADWTHEEMEIIKQEVESGGLPILMPGKQAQQFHLSNLGEVLRPTEIVRGNIKIFVPWEKNGQAKQVIDTSQLLLVPYEVPTKPYIFFVRRPEDVAGRDFGPGAILSGSSREVHVRESQIMRDKAGKFQPMTLPEYLAFQSVYTVWAANEMYDSGKKDPKLIPFDINTATRFPVGWYDPFMLTAKVKGDGQRRISIFCESETGPAPNACIRVVRRIPIGKNTTQK